MTASVASDWLTPDGHQARTANVPAETDLQRRLHRRHRNQQTVVINALADTGHLPDLYLARRLATCCNEGWLVLDPDADQVHLQFNACGSRHCPVCGRSRAARMAAALEDLIRPMRYAAHITLTVPSTDAPLSAQFANLRNGFARFRRTPFWRSHVAGGAWTSETTRNPATGRWHPHLHIIADCTFIPHAELAAAWQDVMPGAHVVWIRAVQDAGDAAMELAKYVCKPPTWAAWPTDAILEYVHAVQGHRLMNTFGSCRTRRLPPAEDPPARKPARDCVPLSVLVRFAANAHPVAADVAALAWLRYPRLRDVLENLCPTALCPDRLATIPDVHLPRAPPLPSGSPGPVTDPADLDAIDAALASAARSWVDLVKAGYLG